MSGDPAPAVNWTKDGNLLPFNQKVMTNLTTGESQLVITGVRNEDIGGKYRCVASNRVGRKESKAAVLSLMVVLPVEEGMCSLTFYLLSFLPSFLPFFQSDVSSSLTPCKQVSRFKFKFQVYLIYI